MKIGYGPEQQIVVTAYEPGDLVALFANQAGELGAGRAGDWGRVKAVDSAGRLTIQVAGFSAPANAALVTLSGVPSRIVRPCDARGRAVALTPGRGRLSDALWGSKWDKRA
jgi:hypothetical protein